MSKKKQDYSVTVNRSMTVKQAATLCVSARNPQEAEALASSAARSENSVHWKWDTIDTDWTVFVPVRAKLTALATEEEAPRGTDETVQDPHPPLEDGVPVGHGGSDGP